MSEKLGETYCGSMVVGQGWCNLPRNFSLEEGRKLAGNSFAEEHIGIAMTGEDFNKCLIKKGWS